jgi:hypothetical protein
MYFHVENYGPFFRGFDWAETHVCLAVLNSSGIGHRIPKMRKKQHCSSLQQLRHPSRILRILSPTPLDSRRSTPPPSHSGTGSGAGGRRRSSGPARSRTVRRGRSSGPTRGGGGRRDLGHRLRELLEAELPSRSPARTDSRYLAMRVRALLGTATERASDWHARLPLPSQPLSPSRCLSPPRRRPSDPVLSPARAW